MRTFAQSASSSSAMTSGSEVIDPCPISVATDMMVMVPSGAMLTHGLRSCPVRSAESTAAAAVPDSAKANDNPAAPIITWRRDTARLGMRVCLVMSRLPRGALDGAHDALIGAAATDVRAHVLDDLGARGFRFLLQQIGGAHDLAGLAIAALRHALGEP